MEGESQVRGDCCSGIRGVAMAAVVAAADAETGADAVPGTWGNGGPAKFTPLVFFLKFYIKNNHRYDSDKRKSLVLNYNE